MLNVSQDAYIIVVIIIAPLLMMLKMISDFRLGSLTPPASNLWDNTLIKNTLPHQHFTQWFKHPSIIVACPIRFLNVKKI